MMCFVACGLYDTLIAISMRCIFHDFIFSIFCSILNFVKKIYPNNQDRCANFSRKIKMRARDDNERLINCGLTLEGANKKSSTKES